MEFQWLVNAFVTLFVIIDPVGLLPIFLVTTSNMTKNQRLTIARHASVTATIILTSFALFGTPLLNTLGISLSAFRIAGGILLFWTATEMIFGKRQERKEGAARQSLTKADLRNIAIFPLAIPLMSGPGAISAVVLLSSERSSLIEVSLLVALISVIFLIAFIVFMLADQIDKFLDDSGRSLISRLLGILLAALSVQFIVDGIRASFAIGL